MTPHKRITACSSQVQQPQPPPPTARDRDSPDEAFHDLARRLEAIQPTRVNKPNSGRDRTWWHWELRRPTRLGRERGRVTTVSRTWRGKAADRK